MGDMVIAIIFEEPDSGDPLKDAPRLAEIIDRAQKLGRDIPDVKIQMARADAAATIRFFTETGELPTDAPVKEPGTLMLHARRELEIIGEEPDVIQGYLKVIQAFEEIPESDVPGISIPVITDLLWCKNLKGLTNNPDEWMEIYDNTWQSRRRADAFSTDGGETYYTLEESGSADPDKRVIHMTEKVV